MSEPENSPAPQGAQDERDRRLANVALLALFALVVGIGIWLADAMIEQRKIDDCVAQGGRGCGRIEPPAR